MKSKFNAKKWFKNLTPNMAWDQYVGMSERIFISNFYAEGVYDIKQMCTIYASEIPQLYYGVLFNMKDIKLIGELLEQYLKAYLKKIGGIDNMEFYTVEELDEMFYEGFEEMVQEVMKKYNITRDQFTEASTGENKKPKKVPRTDQVL